ncbi:ComEA family DNA-binding protein [Oceanobacter mangrovi]|uniref:ComEA family DNA-binding protein n=1 Tax=Oceanobacter mangrovi TaxID=2862510 RepID=UPI001C8EA60A|nr:ComEA family DNA-binding protein [Oceanobacter mangrovi]
MRSLKLVSLMLTALLTLPAALSANAVETTAPASPATVSEVEVTAPGKININTATAAELTSLKGIGSAKAAAIVSYREQNGPFKTLDDLTQVRGIGPSTVENNRLISTVE